ncbi:hypothetical protein B0T26DRAFT_51942 [Lasiosphaeria miniovina]|uniref:Uncharacterized protein n=1 Tax=Lasiosphaeria miniovina TaxID=1954250 RepID=A0AA40ED89_9PEZI|nr:uncharacterized protein B0T26DRAFT_51942 [Lasiosphaeria miniovina]KAK0734092.1 hypothetical protein B0T26DRAFT_51942 [Lasiosphaeria miniovina]
MSDAWRIRVSSPMEALCLITPCLSTRETRVRLLRSEAWHPVQVTRRMEGRRGWGYETASWPSKARPHPHPVIVPPVNTPFQEVRKTKRHGHCEYHSKPGTQTFSGDRKGCKSRGGASNNQTLCHPKSKILLFQCSLPLNGPKVRLVFGISVRYHLCAIYLMTRWALSSVISGPFLHRKSLPHGRADRCGVLLRNVPARLLNGNGNATATATAASRVREVGAWLNHAAPSVVQS